MGISCSCDFGYDEWWYYEPLDYNVYSRTRRKRCCSCKSLINNGDVCTEFLRQRYASELEEQITNSDIVELASYFMCEECSDLYFSLRELGYCITLPDNMRVCAKEVANGGI